MAPVANDFEKIIHTARERKKNEALADKIFSNKRRQPPSFKPSAPRGSLASRVGVKKPQQQTRPPTRPRASIPAGDVNGEWTHDLHNAHDQSPKGHSLRSRVTHQPAHSSAPAVSHNAAHNNSNNRSTRKRAAQIGAALDRMDTEASSGPQPFQGQQQQQSTPASSKPAASGISIRGIAGPFAVMAQNFAPGTTAADIESAMTPVGGEMASCTVIKTQPMMLVEMVFLSREGGERVIQTFHNKTADGRVIQVFAKPGGYQADYSSRNGTHARSPRDQVVDGRNGFSEDLMAVEDTPPSSNDRLYYVDKAGSTNRRGRGFQRGQGTR